MIDTKITNCKIVTEHGIIKAGIGIDKGKIVSIASGPNLPKSDKAVDARGNFVIPGVIDPHVHLGLTPSEDDFKADCRTETVSAACGGVTSIISFLRSNADSYKKVLDDRVKIVERESLVDVGFHIEIRNETDIGEMPDYVRMGMPSAKFYLAYKGKEGAQLGISSSDDATLYLGFELLGRCKGLPMIHAENGEILQLLQRRSKGDGLEAWASIRPSFCEAESIQRACFIANICKVSLYIVHLSSAEGLAEVRAAKNGKQKVIAEVCPHHLSLTATGQGMIEPLWGKNSPPLRTKNDVSILWEGLKDHYISCMGTDHTAIKLSDKVGKDVWSTRVGFPGVETLLPLMLSEGVNKARISIEDLVRICCSNNARVHGLWPRKGSISVGSDADLLVLDLKKRKKVCAETLHSYSDFTPYEGWTLTGWPHMTIARGNIVMHNDEVFEKENFGKFLKRHLNEKDTEASNDHEKGFD